MTNHIIEISDQAKSLRIHNGLLEINLITGETKTVVPSDVAVLLLSNPHIRLSQAVFSTITEEKGFVVIVGKNYLPCGMLLPLDGNATLSETFHAQINASVPLSKRLWKQLVKNKIETQAEVLTKTRKNDYGLYNLSQTVKSGDSSNIEARASRIYWKKLLGESFKRDRDEADINIFLNYGYTVLRACVARAICSAGLLPVAGIHHHNRYNSFCLADDLVEPFRALIDLTVYELSNNINTEDLFLTPEIKRKLIKPITSDIRSEKGSENLFSFLSRMCASLVRCYQGKTDKLILPQKLFI